MKKMLVALIAFVMVLSALPGLARESETRILVIETTDIHGCIFDASSGDPATFQYRMARIARMIGEIGSSGLYEGLLLMDGGDIYQGAPVSALTGGAAMRAVIDMMPYDAVTLGNHEFDWDVREYAADGEGTVAPYVLGDYYGDGKTPVLASGLYDARTGERVPFTRDYTVVEKAGKRIAVIGYIPDYRGDVMTDRIAPYRIDGSLEKLDALSRRVRETEKPDAVVILAHEGPASVAAAMDPGIVTLVCGGHTHETAIGTAENGVPYIQGGSNARGFASAVLVFDPEGNVRAEEMKYTDVMADPAALYDTPENEALLDPAVMALSRAAWDAVSEEMSEVLGYIDTPVVRSRRVGASSAGNWITGLMLRWAQPLGAVAAFYNAGGIRTDLRIPKGQENRAVTVYDVYTIAPFGNSLLVYELTGAEIRQLLVNALAHPNHGDQVSGLTFTYTATGDRNMDRAAREYTILSITLDDGTAVDPEDTRTIYRVCVSSYNATVPGSVFQGKESVVPEADAPVDYEAFILLLREEGAAHAGRLAVDAGQRGAELDPAAQGD